MRRCCCAVDHGNSRQGNGAASAAAARRASLCSERHAVPSAATAALAPCVPPQRRFRQCHIHLPIKATAACPRDGFPSGCALRWHSGCGARFACCCRGLTLPFLSPSFPCSMTSLLASWASRPACFCGRYPLREPVDEASTSMTLPPTPAALLPPSELSLFLHVGTESPFARQSLPSAAGASASFSSAAPSPSHLTLLRQSLLLPFLSSLFVPVASRTQFCKCTSIPNRA